MEEDKVQQRASKQDLQTQKIQRERERQLVLMQQQQQEEMERQEE